MRSSSARNPALLCAFNALQMSLFPVSVMTLFWKHDVGMSMSQIFSVQAFFGLTMAVFEFPSGYIADRLGYRRTLVAASVLGVLGWALYSRAGSIAGVVLAEAVLGVSISLVSGCDAALLYESLAEDGREVDFARWLGRTRFFGQASEGSAALAAGLMYVVDPSLPFMVQSGVAVLSLCVSLALHEPRRHAPVAGEHWAQIRQLVRHALYENKPLSAVLALTIALSMASFVPVWLVPLYATSAGVPEAWIGPIWAAANYIVAIASLLSSRIASQLGLVAALGVCVALIAAAYTGLAASHAMFGFAFYFLLTFMRGLFGPVLMHIENRLIPSSDRAGFLSFRSLLFRVSFLALGPLVGWGVDVHGMHPVLWAVGALLSVASLAAWLRFASLQPHAAAERAHR